MNVLKDLRFPLGVAAVGYTVFLIHFVWLLVFYYIRGG